MAQLTIRLRCDPTTGKKDIIISLRSDEDTLPQEHEQQHRELVERILEREEEEPQSLPPVRNDPTPERQAQKQGD
jgi:hypothetical protein